MGNRENARAGSAKFERAGRVSLGRAVRIKYGKFPMNERAGGGSILGMSGKSNKLNLEDREESSSLDLGERKGGKRQFWKSGRSRERRRGGIGKIKRAG